MKLMYDESIYLVYMIADVGEAATYQQMSTCACFTPSLLVGLKIWKRVLVSKMLACLRNRCKAMRDQSVGVSFSFALIVMLVYGTVWYGFVRHG